MCFPRDLGGLGLLDLCRFGIVVMIRWQWFCMIGKERAWTSLLESLEHAEVAFSTATDSLVGDGRTTLFWLDRWVDG